MHVFIVGASIAQLLNTEINKKAKIQMSRTVRVVYIRTMPVTLETTRP